MTTNDNLAALVDSAKQSIESRQEALKAILDQARSSLEVHRSAAGSGYIAAQPGARYVFGFDLSGRVEVSSESAAVEVLWEGKVVDTILPPAFQFGFVHHSYDLVATGTASRIELRAVTRDGSGPVVDNLGMQFQGLTGQ